MRVLLYDEAKTSLLCYPAGKANTTFSIPETVTVVGTYAFVGSSSLTEISIRNGVVSIESPRTIVNVSARVDLGQWEIVTPGFTVVGDQKKLLIRAVGPKLVDLGVPSPMQNPTMSIYKSQGDGNPPDLVVTIDD